MRVALHCGTLRGFGSGLVGRNLVEHLAAQGPEHRFLVWVPSEWAAEHGVTPARVASNVELRYSRPGIAQKITLENWHIRRALKDWRADVLFSAGDTSLLFCPVPHLLLVHQANLVYGRTEKDYPVGFAMRLRWMAMAAYLRVGLGSVTALTVQTAEMAKRSHDRFGYPRERITVVPSSVGRAEKEPSACDDLDEAPPFVTYVASASPHKNFEVLAPMMALLRNRCPGLQCRLTIAPGRVPALEEAIDRLQVADRFVFEGPVSGKRAQQLIRRARVLVMPSKLESFGISYYESLAEGTPVVAADRPFAREACGVAASYANANSGEEFADRVADLVLDEGHRQAAAEASRDRFEEVSVGWDVIAAKYLAILETLVEGERRG